jgi:hypothetical protein
MDHVGFSIQRKLKNGIRIIRIHHDKNCRFRAIVCTFALQISIPV